MAAAPSSMAGIMETASALSHLLRLLASVHQDLGDVEDQEAIAWLLPVAARMAADIAAVAEAELNRQPPGTVG
jgi:hypothetical protein